MSACICNSHRFPARSLPWADKWRVVALLREGLSGRGGASMAAAAEAAAMADQSAYMRCVCVYMYTCVCVCVYMCMYIDICMYVYRRAGWVCGLASRGVSRARGAAGTSVYMRYIYMYLCVYLYIHIYI